MVLREIRGPFFADMQTEQCYTAPAHGNFAVIWKGNLKTSGHDSDFAGALLPCILGGFRVWAMLGS